MFINKKRNLEKLYQRLLSNHGSKIFNFQKKPSIHLLIFIWETPRILLTPTNKPRQSRNIFNISHIFLIVLLYIFRQKTL